MMAPLAGGDASSPVIFPPPMDSVDLERDLCLTLARALLPPMDPTMARAFRTELADDLAELAEGLGLQADDHLAALRRCLGDLPTDDALLVHYSELFLPPNIAARLNLCLYLDGSVSGGSRDALDTWYARHGLIPRADFHDLPDHLAMLLEFLAVLEAEEDRAAFARGFLLPALPRLAADIAAFAAHSPYLPLVRLLAAALGHYAATADAAATARNERRARRQDTELGLWRHCQTCGKPFAREKELAIMAKALAQQGLPIAHLDTCPDCRNPVGP